MDSKNHNRTRGLRKAIQLPGEANRSTDYFVFN